MANEIGQAAMDHLGIPKAGPGETRAQIKHLIARGWTPKAIAKHLDISTSAVYQHLAKIREEEEGQAS